MSTDVREPGGLWTFAASDLEPGYDRWSWVCLARRAETLLWELRRRAAVPSAPTPTEGEQ